ncbi:hypothetical protein B0J11DRAFT_574700 [Dendryphion nanum]|uniref:Uncharacterized protein n=1 Tax=Dendryphion nanum TaxID=256645 RepID=A0A9P9EKG5_9PLEO|nr:hypothetical protein B0J11DRAFT_574700 [Dendryphion nanum]
MPRGEDSTYARWLNWLGHLHLYNACGGTAAEFKILNPRSIALRGVIVNEIKFTGSDFDSISQEDALHEMYNLARISPNVEEGEHYCDNTITKKAAFWTTMCGSIEYFLDTAREKQPFFRRIPMPTEFSRFEKWEAWSLAQSKVTLDEDVRSVQWPLSILTKGRKFTVTTRGYMSFCPTRCMKGDLVAVVTGGSVPLILRPHRTSENAERLGLKEQYTLIGDSYIHGLTDVEALETKDGGADRLEDLVLL